MDRREALLDCYRAADVFVFASRTETQGLVLLESLALGLPVVSTAVLGTKEVLEGAAGAIVVREDVVARRWSSREMAQRLLALYEEIKTSRLASAEGRELRPAWDRR